MSRFKQGAARSFLTTPWLARTVASLLALVPVLAPGCRRQSAQPAGTNAVPPAPVIVATATSADVPIDIRAVGRVETYNTVTVRPRVSGQIEAVHFADGQYVSTGTLLFAIDQRPFQAAVDVAKANLARDKAQAAEAAKKAQQYEVAYQRKAAAQVDRDTAVANAEAAAATVQGDEASLENAQLQLGYCTIRSPIDGKAGDRLADIGNIVTADVTPLVIINQIKPIYVTFAVPERYLAEIHARMATEPPEVDATIPGENGVVKKGKLTFIDNQVNPATGAITLKGTFANDDRALWPGQFVNVSLLLGVQERLLIPTEAIQASQEGDYVYLLMPGDTVERRTVVPGRTVGTRSVIKEGLSAGDIVVTEGQLRLRPGAKVVVQEATTQTANVPPAGHETTGTKPAASEPAQP
jgi:multidrug efflux system membrane fusion protein